MLLVSVLLLLLLLLLFQIDKTLTALCKTRPLQVPTVEVLLFYFHLFEIVAGAGIMITEALHVPSRSTLLEYTGIRQIGRPLGANATLFF